MESHFTMTVLIWFIPCICSSIISEINHMLKRLITITTLIFSYTWYTFHLIDNLTNLTWRFISLVSTHWFTIPFYTNITFLTSALWSTSLFISEAIITLIWFLFCNCMNSHMMSKTIFTTEHLVTIITSTWLLPCVCISITKWFHMDILRSLVLQI